MPDKEIGIPERIAVVQNARFKVEAVYLGEGYRGDYDPKDPKDEPLMRFDVYEHKYPDETLYSYCTMTSARNAVACSRLIQMVLESDMEKQSIEQLTWIDANKMPEGSFKREDGIRG